MNVFFSEKSCNFAHEFVVLLYTINLYEYFPLPPLPSAVNVTVLSASFFVALIASGFVVSSSFTFKASLLTVLPVVLSFNN